MSTSDLRYERLRAEHAPGVAELFEREELPCHCRYWHFHGDKNEWLARCSHERDENRAEFAAAARSDELQGIVALDAAQGVVGWLKITDQSAVSKLYQQRLYRGLPCFEGDRSGVMTIGCFLVEPRLRRQGVARGLLRAALREARAAGARVLEAFPRRGDAVPEAELWLGPYPLLRAEGFQVVHDFGPYPVLRLTL